MSAWAEAVVEVVAVVPRLPVSEARRGLELREDLLLRLVVVEIVAIGPCLVANSGGCRGSACGPAACGAT
eukprot:3689932-Pyramimonas_sp.AAC.1